MIQVYVYIHSQEIALLTKRMLGYRDDNILLVFVSRA